MVTTAPPNCSLISALSIITAVSRPTAFQKALRVRDNYTCQWCGAQQGEVHHGRDHDSIVSLWTWPNKITTDNMDDYVTICGSCRRMRQQDILWTQAADDKSEDG